MIRAMAAKIQRMPQITFAAVCAEGLLAALLITQPVVTEVAWNRSVFGEGMDSES